MKFERIEIKYCKTCIHYTNFKITYKFLKSVLLEMLDICISFSFSFVLSMVLKSFLHQTATECKLDIFKGVHTHKGVDNATHKIELLSVVTLISDIAMAMSRAY